LQQFQVEDKNIVGVSVIYFSHLNLNEKSI
jgi:hypothetical protein